MSETPEHVLVLGATGKTGARVARRLRERGLRVRAGSRAAEVPFDWDDAPTWAPAVAGITAVYIAFQPDLAVPGAPEAVRAFGEVAVAAGVRRLVLLSGRGEEEARAAEQALFELDADVTVVRSSFFAQNFSEGNFLEPVRAGQLVLPVGAVPEPFIDVDDVAEVAVVALTEDGHAGQVYEVTGPRLLTFAEAVAEMAAAAGRSIDYVQVSPEDYAAALTDEGVPAEFVDFLIYLFTTVLDGRNAQVSDGVERALGRPARDFAEYAKTAAATGIWDAP
ncbi:NAD(P)H-binding protein [Nocardia sp. NPDC050710]|uniref:NAD(P)H-binding protein n=1 Tax=Nocardia sp. NPDC050710 TaxID=3157220 RepID=UPI0034114652